MKLRNTSERGAAIVTAILLILVIAALCYAFLTNTAVLNREHHARTAQTRVLYIAEAGANVGAVEILPTLALNESRTVGASDDLIAMDGGGYWLDATSHADGSYTLLSHAVHARSDVTLETKWERSLHPIRDHAIFSGNIAGDATHDLEFGGTGRTADLVNG